MSELIDYIHCKAQGQLLCWTPCKKVAAAGGGGTSFGAQAAGAAEWVNPVLCVPDEKTGHSTLETLFCFSSEVNF